MSSGPPLRRDLGVAGALLLGLLLVACSSAQVPDDDHGVEAPESGEQGDEAVDPHEALRSDPSFELRLNVEPEDPEDYQIVALVLYTTEERRESPGVHPDGTTAEVQRQIGSGEQSSLVDSLAAKGFFDGASSARSSRVEAPTTAPQGDGEYEPPAGGVLRVVLQTHDDDWYHYRWLVVEDREQAIALLSGLMEQVEHETAANLFGLVDVLMDPF